MHMMKKYVSTKHKVEGRLPEPPAKRLKMAASSVVSAAVVKQDMIELVKAEERPSSSSEEERVREYLVSDNHKLLYPVELYILIRWVYMLKLQGKSKHKKKKHKHKKKHKKSKNKTKHKERECSDRREIDTKPKGKTLAELRAERLNREQAEKQRTKQLFAKLRGEKSREERDLEKSLDDRSRGYNSQFNPELARKRKKKPDWHNMVEQNN